MQAGTPFSVTFLSQGGDAHCVLPKGSLTSRTGGSAGAPLVCRSLTVSLAGPTQFGEHPLVVTFISFSMDPFVLGPIRKKNEQNWVTDQKLALAFRNMGRTFRQEIELEGPSRGGPHIKGAETEKCPA